MPITCTKGHSHESAADVRSCHFEVTPTAGGWLVKAGRAATDQRERYRTHKRELPGIVGTLEAIIAAGPDKDAKRCGRCAGTGSFITYVENDVPKGPGGPCFRCSGKGHQTDCGPDKHRARAEKIRHDVLADEADTSACCDRVRNDLYDRYGMRLSW